MEQTQKRLDLGPLVSQIIDKLDTSEMLYYGEDTDFWRSFKPSRPVEIEAYYDSLIGGERASPSTLVVSMDYLHQVGMLRIFDILDDLKRVTMGIGVFHVRTVQEVDDVRFVDKPYTWWLSEILRRFDLQTFQKLPEGFYVIVSPKAH